MSATEDLDRVTARLCANMLNLAGSIDMLARNHPELVTPALEGLRDNLRLTVMTYERESQSEKQ